MKSQALVVFVNLLGRYLAANDLADMVSAMNCSCSLGSVSGDCSVQLSMRVGSLTKRLSDQRFGGPESSV